ncbi:MAG: hypothetical protein MEP57_07480 [Microvirga sp.]|nr:hypothetical protein [Microvirga sp.]
MQDPKIETPTRLQDEPPSQYKSEELEQEPVVASVKEARQGPWGKPVLVVLVVGLALAVIAGWILGGTMF